jgi:hypothetical protein
VDSQVGCQHRVPEIKETLQLVRKERAKWPSEERQLVVNFVEHRRERVAVRDKAVAMLPGLKRPLHLIVGEELVLEQLAVAQQPAQANRT